MRHSVRKRLVVICYSLVGLSSSCAVQAQVDGKQRDIRMQEDRRVRTGSREGEREQGGARIVDDHLERDGKPWTPHGFYQIAFEVPPTNFANSKLFWQTAYRNFSPSEYSLMRQEGADSVRLQIAQNGANPDNKEFYDEQWFQQVVKAIRSARAAGLTVIVALQTEKQTGLAKRSPLPDGGTRRVWGIIAPIFAHDHGVLYELYNEPNERPNAGANNAEADAIPTRGEWDSWATAMNDTISVVRRAGADNVVVVDGLALGQQLNGAPELEDPLRQVLYAVHPYTFNDGNSSLEAYSQSAVSWDKKFGNFSLHHPVIVSEWGIGFFCNAQTAQSVVNFLRYLDRHHIGLEAGMWDYAPAGSNNVTHGYPDVQFTTFRQDLGQSCTLNNATPNYGAGETIESWYRTGVPPTAPQ